MTIIINKETVAERFDFDLVADSIAPLHLPTSWTGAQASMTRSQDDDHMPREPRPRRMLKLEQVLQIVPVSDVTLWRMEKDGLFPKGDFISYNTKVWYEDEIIAWQNSTSGRSRGRRPRKTRR